MHTGNRDMANESQDEGTTPARTVVDDRTVRLIRTAAEVGKAEAQYRLGMMYANEDGVPLDYREAAKWLLLAAEQDHPQAQGALGWLYAVGYGVKQDGAEAAQWYLRSAEQGVAQSQYRLAGMYQVGANGLPQDPRRMVEWYRRAAEQHFAPAQNMLGKLMVSGQYLARDPIGAFQWLSLAVMNGSEAAQKGLDEVCREMTAEQLDEARGLFLAGLEAQGVDVAPVREMLEGSGHLL